MKKVIYTCPYIPAEWIAAHGLQPGRIIPQSVQSAGSIVPIEGVCPYVRCFVNDVLNNSEALAVIVTTLCDQMRRAFEIIQQHSKVPLFLMNVPSSWQSLSAQKLYIDEVKRLGRFLVKLGGQAPSNECLLKVITQFDDERQAVLNVRAFVPSQQYSQAIAQFNQNGKSEYAENISHKKVITADIPLAIIGGPLLREDFRLFEVVRESGGRIVLDATETGELGMCAAFDRRNLHRDSLGELCRAYFDGIAHPASRPNSRFYNWLKKQLSNRLVRAIIFRRYVWCDIWHAELYRIKEWTKLPVLDLDVSDDRQSIEKRDSKKIQAFLETLQ